MKQSIDNQIDLEGLSSRNRKVIEEHLSHAARSLWFGYVGFGLCILFYLSWLLPLFSPDASPRSESEISHTAALIFLSIFLTSHTQNYLHKVRLGRAIIELLNSKHEKSEHNNAA